MYILISNDDGVNAPGIKALYDALANDGDCKVLAPMRDMSGTSNSLTLNRPLYPTYLENGFVGIDGTPADCVHLGMNGFFDNKPDLVVAGINLGANLGDDVLYSGTVAAATEGRFTAMPSFAFSLVSKTTTHLATAAYYAKNIIKEYAKLELPKHTVLNVNIPDLPLEQVKGIQLTRLGYRTHSLPPEKTVNPRGKVGYWVSRVGDIVDGSEGTDFYAIKAGYVSITPLTIDRSCRSSLDSLQTLRKL
ncbi:5'/3'-nucleotidase SurE [Entomomonas moraniae]|uniref:5'-nucleotidase SurE n=1 Tax=Entomomonas moraniae TaxID=2213226 RepID=A0A3Q9JGV9_9GAMM|nr:5'/3'-nucleotidase SurE [Entomomonas moraniae]AZS49263.1 5'/3'-nucleotidase SurE [Entomomonas moraniae]